jgi:hypothetical protein
VALCEAEDLAPLVYQRAGDSAGAIEWPESLRHALSAAAHAEAAAEMVRGVEIRAALEALMNAGVAPVLLKGTPLAYSVYDGPSMRPRGDTDLIVPEEQVSVARSALLARGFTATIHCDDLFSQFEVQKRGTFGIVHAFDVHWKISTQPIFAELLTYEELERDAARIPALGPHAKAAGPLHALLLACVHPVMHHQNTERLLWIYDVHLLASRLTADQFDAFAAMALERQMAGVCAHELRLAHRVFGTAIPSSVFRRLSAPPRPEPSSAYLSDHRRWHHELLSSVTGLPRWSDRARHLRQVLFPSPQYMLAMYRVRRKALGALILPALYLHRNLNGAWKILGGKK